MSNMGKGAGYYLTRSKSLLIDTAIVAILAIFMSFAMQMDTLQSKGDDYLVLMLYAVIFGLAGEISKDMLQQEKITKRIEWKLANGIKISSIVKENLLSLWIGTLILLFPLLLIISIRLPNLILLLGTYFLILSILYSAFINVLILWIRNMNWFKSIPIFATLLHILLVVLKCGIFMKTNNVWVLLLFSPVSIIVLTACGLCLMTKERIVSSYY